MNWQGLIMINNKKIPQLRFRGFTDLWEMNTLGEISDVTKLAGFEFTEYIQYADEGSIVALRGLNVKNGKIVLDNVKYIDTSDFSKLGRSKLFKNDILFTYVGTVGELAVIPINDRYYLAPNVARIRLKENNNPIFISQMMRSKVYYNKIVLPLIATSSQPALSMENLRKFDLILPTCKQEQEKIGNFFQKLDTLIELRQKESIKLKNIKKAMLSKLFPQNGSLTPQLRFRGFTDNWETKTLGEVADISTGYPFDSKLFNNNGEYLVITNGNIQNDLSTVIEDFGNRINIYDTKLNEYILNKNDILITMDGTVGRTAKVIVENQILAQRVGRITSKIDSEFSYFLLNTGDFFASMTLVSHGGTIKHISLTEISNYLIKIPVTRAEQEKIGNFFQKLDTLIELRQQELIKLKNIKKAYLDKMFI